MNVYNLTVYIIIVPTPAVHQDPGYERNVNTILSLAFLCEFQSKCSFNLGSRQPVPLMQSCVIKNLQHQVNQRHQRCAKLG